MPGSSPTSGFDAVMGPRRVLFVVTKMNQGGAMMMPLQIASALRSRGYEAEVWYLYRQNPAYEDEPGVRVIFPDRPSGLADYFRIFRRSLGDMRKFRPDAVHGVLPLGNFFGLLGAEMIGCSSRVASQHSPASAYRPIMRWLDMMLGTFGCYTGNIAVSRAVLQSFAGHPQPYRRRLQVVYNAVPSRLPRRAKSDARRHFGLPEHAPVLGTVGRLAYEKNHEFLFPLVERLDDVHLAIAGGGPLEGQYAEQVRASGLEHRIHLLGPIDGADVPDFLNAIDVFVFPSRFEGLPVALLEAMTAGLPIVASDLEVTREVLWPEGRERAGLLLSLDSAEAWVEALRGLVQDPEQLQRLADAAKRRATDFAVDAMIDNYEISLFGTKRSK
jgi:glycosyltransferase involved in cell wall biosynthesis